MIYAALVFLASVGDVASYSKDSCTSSMIRTLDADVEIVSETDDKFKLDIDWVIKTRFARKSGSNSKSLSKYLFTEQFLIDLRANGTYEDDEIKITHRGRDGECDKVSAEIDDLDDPIKAKICFGRPVLGIVEAEANGEISGATFRACVELD